MSYPIETIHKIIESMDSRMSRLIKPKRVEAERLRFAFEM